MSSAATAQQEAGAPPPTALEGAPGLRLTGIDKHFPGVQALKGVDLEGLPGEVHAIVGENGAGKSTLMAVAAGALEPDAGSVVIGGEALADADPDHARELGLAIVYQEPALVPDLTIAENMVLGLPRRLRRGIGDREAWVNAVLAQWRPDGTLDPRAPVRDAAPDERFIVEIARALAEQPKVLILDEPTEHLLPEDVARLFARVKDVTDAGGTVIYISHRIPEVKQIADRITVLRDGAVRGTFEAEAVSEDEVVALIVGRSLDSRFPAKATNPGAECIVAHSLRGYGLSDVDLAIRSGEIIGFAGIEGQGQRDALRALAGLHRCQGEVTLDGRALRLRDTARAARAGIVHVPNDRHHDGIVSKLTVRENLTLGALGDLDRAGFVVPSAERALATEQRKRFAIKAPNLERPIDELSGGNQQKVVLSRALAGNPRVVLADEPTQGVDAGARVEIYETLRDSAERGAGVAVMSSNNSELAGLCDRVLVFSRGRVVQELAGDDVSEHTITNAVLTAATERRESLAQPSRLRVPQALTRSDRAPAAVLAGFIVALAVWATATDPSYLSGANLTSVLTLFAALAFIALGQQLVMFTGGIDLSVGPLVGMLVVIASFQLSNDLTTLGLLLGAPVVLGAALAVGFGNWALVSVVRIQPMIATLVTYLALQGVSLLLRPEPGGTISESIADLTGPAIGWLPVAAVVAVATGLALEFSLRSSRWGWRLRALGSSPEAARRMGVRDRPVLIGAYLGCAALTLLGAIMVMAQVGSGDPTTGINYTFASIAAVVLGGASIFGGRGSFIGALVGALLVVQINTVGVFVHLDDAWQLYLLGGLTLVAAGFYSVARSTP